MSAEINSTKIPAGALINAKAESKIRVGVLSNCILLSLAFAHHVEQLVSQVLRHYR